MPHPPLLLYFRPFASQAALYAKQNHSNLLSQICTLLTDAPYTQSPPAYPQPSLLTSHSPRKKHRENQCFPDNLLAKQSLQKNLYCNVSHVETPRPRSPSKS